jgi:integrase
MGLFTYVNKDGSSGYGIRYWIGTREVRERIGPSKRQAELVLAKRKIAIREQKFGLTRDTTPRPFATHFAHWLDTYVKTETKASTAAFYITAYRQHLLPFFGQQDIRAITREEVKRFLYQKHAAGLACNSIKGYLAPLSEMFNHAIEDGYCERNPCIRILRISRKDRGEQHRKIEFFARDELALLLETCQRTAPGYYPLVLLLARTGLRAGEAVALQWGDCDFHSRFLQVQRNYVDGAITTPKSGLQRRVDMSQQLTAVLQHLLTQRKAETLRRGWNEMPPWVIISQKGTLLDPDNVRKRAWARLLTVAGLRYVGLHALRHTFASLLIQQGAPLAYVKEQLGHSSIRVTVDTYGHLIPGGNREEVDKLDHFNPVLGESPMARARE